MLHKVLSFYIKKRETCQVLLRNINQYKHEIVLFIILCLTNVVYGGVVTIGTCFYTPGISDMSNGYWVLSVIWAGSVSCIVYFIYEQIRLPKWILSIMAFLVYISFLTIIVHKDIAWFVRCGISGNIR